MARLPELKTEGVYVERPERDEWADRTKSLFAVVGEAVRKGVAAEKKDGYVEKNKSD